MRRDGPVSPTHTRHSCPLTRPTTCNATRMHVSTCTCACLRLFEVPRHFLQNVLMVRLTRRNLCVCVCVRGPQLQRVGPVASDVCLQSPHPRFHRRRGFAPVQMVRLVWLNLHPVSRLTLTLLWSTWSPSWAAWSTAAFTTRCCWRSELWPTDTRLYWGAEPKTSTG